MTDSTIHDLIIAVPSTIAAVASGVAVVMAAINGMKMGQLEKNTNSKMDQLLQVKGESEHAKGKLEGAREEAGATLPATVKRQERET
jgi:hypothetical protein